MSAGVKVMHALDILQLNSNTLKMWSSYPFIFYFDLPKSCVWEMGVLRIANCDSMQEEKLKL